MTTNSSPSMHSPSAISRIYGLSKLLYCGALLLLAFTISCLMVCAQSNVKSPTDGMTPLQLQPGTPEGSYALSGFDNVNLYNGSLSFDLPLVKVGGRSGFGYTVQLPLEVHWQVLNICSNGMQSCDPSQTIYNPAPVAQSFYYTPQMRPVSLYGRYSNSEPTTYTGDGYSCTYYLSMLTRLTVVNADGTEIELRDALTDGQPLPGNGGNYCTNASSRGTVFKSSDGSAMTFISDTPISDQVANGTYMSRNFTGYLLTRDGTRYRIETGNVTWMRDRNGNRIDFTAGTDTLGRSLPTLTQHLDGNGVDLYDTITFAGTGGVTRTITVTYANLDAVLRPDYTIQTYHGLFPNIGGASSYNTFDPRLVASVTIPNGQHYQFKYNSYGEMARVDLPSGGRVEYDFSGADSNQNIIRTVVARRVYSDAGTTLVGSTIYSYAPFDSPPRTIVTVDHLDASGALVAREKHYYHGFVGEHSYVGAAPTLYDGWQEGREYQTDEYAADGTTILRSTVEQWQQRAAVSWWTNPPNLLPPPEDPRVYETDNTVEPSGANLVSKQTFSYDDSMPFNNRSDVYEYDFGVGAAGALKRHTHTDYQTVTSYVDAQAGAHIRDLPIATYVQDGANNTVAQKTMAYDEYSLQSYTSVTGWTDPVTTARGNLTSASSWVNTSNSWLTSHVYYDQVGNPTQHTDARGISSYIGYTDNFSDNINRNTYAFATSTTSAVPDPTGAHGSTSALTTSMQYDFSTGHITQETDANGQVTTAQYNDPGNLDRLTQVNYPDGGQTNYNYTDTPGSLSLQVSIKQDSSTTLQSYKYFDGLGRSMRSQQLVASAGDCIAPNNYTTADTQYDALGRAYRTSNPYCTSLNSSSINPSGNWTTSVFDALGRVKTVTTPDGAVVTTDYSGNQVLVKDQAGKERMSQTNALGQLSYVWEITPTDDSTEAVSFPNHPEVVAGYKTKYEYDVLGNLTTVTQQKGTAGTTQTRSFVYDSLSRLTSATNPESGTLTYQYDADGNLIVKTDARTVSTHYSYDALNRVTRRWYNGSSLLTAMTNNSPALPSSVGASSEVNYSYDTAINGKGRLASVSSSVSTCSYSSYDASGHALGVSETLSNQNGSQTYSMSYGYDLAGHVKSITYPSGHAVTYNYDGAGRLADKDALNLAFTGNLGDGVTRTYSTGISYDQWSGISREQFGTDIPLYHKEHRNIRGQLYDVRLSTVNDELNWNRGAILNYYSAANTALGASGADNNGNLVTQEHWVPADDAISSSSYMQQRYGYDSLNRINLVGEYQNGATNTGSQSYSYDRYGNRTISSASGVGINNQQFTVDANTNRLSVPAGQSGVMQYDQNGNLTTDTYSGAAVLRTFDAENRQVSETQSNNYVAGIYSYDGDGRRVKRNVGGVETWQVYGVGGELLVEYSANALPTSPQKEYGYRSGELLITASVTSGWGAPPVLHDNPLVVGQTTIQSRHITELRDAINALRSHLGLSAYSWQTQAAVGALITASPILEMRTALDQALGAPGAGYSAGLAQGQPIKATHIQELRDRVLAAWNSGTGGIDIRWMVADQLGTPRMIADKSGSLSGISRHDYLPFGEELFAGSGGRTTGQGYTNSDGERQKFTSKERDSETGLDYFINRYYSSTQARFTSPDPLLSSGKALHPQSWNRYSYCINNPLNLIDPSGLDWYYQNRGDKTAWRWYKGNAPKGWNKWTGSSIVNLPRGGSLELLDNGRAIYNRGAVDMGLTAESQSRLNTSAALFDSFVPFGRHIREGVGLTGGIDTRSHEYQNASTGIGNAQMGLLFLPGEGEVKAAESVADDVVVIGHYPEYIQLAEELNARRFNIPEAVWESMSESERWAANQKFLDQAIEHGSEFRLATPIERVRPGSYFEKELEYLSSKGYQLSSDGTRMIPPN